MSNKPAFDVFEFMKKQFGQDKIDAMFDPKKMQSLDLQSLMKSNQKNIEAMTDANQAAADAYKSFCEGQMEVYKEVMTEASKQAQALKTSTLPDLQEKQKEIYAAAVQKSMAIMTEMAATTRQTNEDALKFVRGRVDEALNEIKKN